MSRRELLLCALAAEMAHAFPIPGARQGQASSSQVTHPTELRFFTQDEAADIESIAALIIPADETPGAKEAGVIHFIDLALATFDQEKQSIYRAGLVRIHKELESFGPNLRQLADLNSEQQLQFMERIGDSEFFGVVRTHTVMGFFGAQARGGNSSEIGWKLIGFEDKFSFQPPFGYYDSEAALKAADEFRAIV